MIKIYLTAILLIYLSFAQSQIVDIPDANFKNALLSQNPVIDTNNDGEIQVSEAEAALSIFASNDNISSLEGIQSFSNLETLYCPFNEITTIDVSSNTSLKTLIFNHNDVTNIDVSSNPNLEDLVFFRNNISSIDVSENTELKQIDIGNNDFTTLNLSGNPNLEGIFVYQNPLVWLNIKNGNNQVISQLHAYNTPIICIQVDDAAYANSKICDFGDNYGWCKDASDSYSEDCNLGVDSRALQNLQIAPNPVNDILTISNYDDLFLTLISVYNITGEILVTQRNDFGHIDMSHLKSGVYFIAFEASDNLFIKKVVKK